ncbi:MAG: efflux RND transporter periplasmic adaptor subunit [Acidobacteria bacterium]|nr:MAG: efflux RND transporter periplasmic adaptor subunit [Acidobacteriota bacterium]
MIDETKGIDGTKYRRAFLLTLFALVAVVVAAAWLWWQSPFNPLTHAAQQTSSASVGGEPPRTTIQGTGTETSDGSAASPAETPLAPIQLSPQRMQSIGVKIGNVESRIINDEIRLYGNVQPNERRFAYVQTRFAGWIRQVYADATGDFIRRGQPLFTIYSPDLVATEREYLLAKKNAGALQQSTVSGVSDGAASLIAAARARLQQFDMPDSEIAKLEESGEAITDLTFYSPASGYITERNALPNMYVQPDTKLYAIADLSDVWVLAQIFQNDAGRIKPGDPAEVTVDAYPGQVFRGKVDYLLPQLDAATRTLPVRLVFPNPDLKLRPGMYVNVNLKLPLGKRLVVPDSAVFHSGTKSLVFTYTGKGNIEPREVEMGPHVGNELVVTKGIKAGEQIVTSANFLIDSEAQLQAAAGAFVPPPPGAGQATAMNAPGQTQTNVELTTAPSPPQKGNNTVRVKLTDRLGKPLTGAQVTVTFFMAAMPAMGMAAMRTVVQTSDKGGGTYEGSGRLGSGGTWQVTVTAIQNGQTIANKQVTINATGGM